MKKETAIKELEGKKEDAVDKIRKKAMGYELTTEVQWAIEQGNEKNGLEKLLGVQESSADDNKNSVDSESTGTDGENSANDAEEVNSDETAQTDKPEKTEE